MFKNSSNLFLLMVLGKKKLYAYKCLQYRLTCCTYIDNMMNRSTISYVYVSTLWRVLLWDNSLLRLSNPTLDILVRFSCWFPNFFSLLLFVEFCVCICIYIIHIVSNILHVISSMVLLYLIMKNTLSEIFINHYVYLITHIHTVLSPIIQ